MRYHPPHDFTKGMVQMEWTDPDDVVIRDALPGPTNRRKPGKKAERRRNANSKRHRVKFAETPG